MTKAYVVANNPLTTRLPPQQHIPSPRLGTKAYVIATHPLIDRHIKTRMAWDAAMSRPLQCFTILLKCPMSLNEMWIAIGGLASTYKTHSKPKAGDKSLCGRNTSSDCRALTAKNGMRCSHDKAP
jgi:hypothetical protein